MKNFPRNFRLVFARRAADRVESAVGLDGHLGPEVTEGDAHRGERPRPMAPRCLVQPARGKAWRMSSARSGGMPWRRHFDTACRDTPMARATLDCPIPSSSATASGLRFAIPRVNHTWQPFVKEKAVGVNHEQRQAVDTDAMQPDQPDPLTYAGRLQIAIDSAPISGATRGESAAPTRRSWPGGVPTERAPVIGMTDRKCSSSPRGQSRSEGWPPRG